MALFAVYFAEFQMVIPPSSGRHAMWSSTESFYRLQDQWTLRSQTCC